MIPSLSHLSLSLDGFGPFLGAFTVRRSVRSLSGWVCVLSFPSVPAAGAFARFWAPRLPVRCHGCAVRRAGAVWSVSVPVEVE